MTYLFTEENQLGSCLLEKVGSQSDKQAIIGIRYNIYLTIPGHLLDTRTF